MKIKKLNLSKKNLLNARPNIIWVIVYLVVVILDIYFPVAYYNNEPNSVVISLKNFNGLVVYSDQAQGVSSAIKVQVPFDSTLCWGADAIMVCKKSFSDDGQYSDLIAFRSSKQSCGVFEYSSYDADWKFLWNTECVIYDATRQWIVCYPGTSNWLWGLPFMILVMCSFLTAYHINEIKTNLKKPNQ